MKLRVSFRFSPKRTIPVGLLSSVGRETVFEYADSFLSEGLRPSPFRLPVRPGVFVSDRDGGMETFGLFEDSLPDGWGRRMIDRAYRKEHGRLPTVLERLACVGVSGMGALAYEPAEEGPCPESGSFDLGTLAASAMDFDAGWAEDVLPEIRRAGGSSGGARPKAFIGYNPVTGAVCAEREDLPPGFEHWIVKFNTRAEGNRAGEAEYAYYRMAVAAGAEMAESRLLETREGVFFATKRFDRGPDGARFHLASAAGLLHADFRTPGDEYSILFKLTDALTRDYSAKKQLFLRASLNVLAHNRDDHLKNFAFLMDPHGGWRLAPFYDFTRSEGPNGWQTLSVAGEGTHPGEADLLRLADDVSLSRSDAREAIDRVREAIGNR